MDKYTLIGLTVALIIVIGISSSGLQDDTFVSSEKGTNVTQNNNISNDDGETDKMNGTANGSASNETNSSYNYLQAFM